MTNFCCYILSKNSLILSKILAQYFICLSILSLSKIRVYPNILSKLFIQSGIFYPFEFIQNQSLSKYFIQIFYPFPVFYPKSFYPVYPKYFSSHILSKYFIQNFIHFGHFIQNQFIQNFWDNCNTVFTRPTDKKTLWCQPFSVRNNSHRMMHLRCGCQTLSCDYFRNSGNRVQDSQFKIV